MPIHLIFASLAAALLSTSGLVVIDPLQATANGAAPPAVTATSIHASGAPIFKEDEPSGIKHTEDSLETVKKKLSAGEAVLIDVRDEREWNEGHLKDARHLPLKRILQGVSQEELIQVAPADKIIYLHCASGNRSLQAARELRDHGRDIRALKPGYEELSDAGFPTAN